MSLSMTSGNLLGNKLGSAAICSTIGLVLSSSIRCPSVMSKVLLLSTMSLKKRLSRTVGVASKFTGGFLNRVVPGLGHACLISSIVSLPRVGSGTPVLLKSKALCMKKSQ
ncbi:hypothetical protein V8G54_017222 [Vigna mungo]|uniref:Uncharacterized protein n=1 Tax=Vigna mungo TaxID=3915 RepID=A0AAQ3S028_VIGMU